MKVVNLSSRPFVNERPVVRLTVALWLLAAALLATNVYYYSTYWWDSAEIRGDLAEIRATVREKEQGFGGLREEFSGVDLPQLNEQAVFLNQLIRHRTFPWSQLFDHLEEVLEPHYGIRLLSVSPDLEERKKQFSSRQRSAANRSSQSSLRRRRRSGQSSPPAAPQPAKAEEVRLQFNGVSKSSDAILDFVDTLFAHPSFRDPDLPRENLNEQTSETSFEIVVTYLTQSSRADEPEMLAEDSDESEEDVARGGAEEETAAEDIAREGAAGGEEDEDDQEAERQGRLRVAATQAGAGDDEPGTALRSAGPPPSAMSRPSTAPQATTEVSAAGRPAPGVPAAGAPGAPPAAGAAAAGTPPPPRARPILPRRMPPPVTPPPTSARPTPARPTPARPRPTVAPPPTPPPPPSTPLQEGDRRVRPRFVEPNASGTPKLAGGG